MARRRAAEREVMDADYRALAEFRFALRQYLAFAESAANAAGVPPQQYQALLAIRGSRRGEKPTVGLLAERLLVAPHTALELVRRLETAGHIVVSEDPGDRRRRLLALTPAARRLLARLSAVHLTELSELAPGLAQLLAELVPSGPEPKSAG